MSGHSKWAQIKHKKAITDARKGKLFSKIVREVMVAAKSGPSDPKLNIKLRSAIERARSHGLPKENIERAIARAGGDGKESNLREFLYEATAPEGAQILIEGITDNKNRTLAEIKHLLAEGGGRLAESGSLVWGFEKIGTIEILKNNNDPQKEEETELLVIDAGARDIRRMEGAWVVETGLMDRERVSKELERRGIIIKEVGHYYRAKSPSKPPQELRASLKKLLRDISGHDDVQAVYTNTEEGKL